MMSNEKTGQQRFCAPAHSNPLLYIKELFCGEETQYRARAGEKRGRIGGRREEGIQSLNAPPSLSQTFSLSLSLSRPPPQSIDEKVFAHVLGRTERRTERERERGLF